ncbi:12111_t:CDS:2, partial [Acaulospora morrowiae]
ESVASSKWHAAMNHTSGKLLKAERAISNHMIMIAKQTKEKTRFWGQKKANINFN